MGKPNLKYLDQITTDSDLKNELISLLKREIEEGLLFVSTYDTSADDPDELFSIAHKMSNKFSILCMDHSHRLSQQIIECLREKRSVDQNDINKLKSGLESALDFLNGAV